MKVVAKWMCGAGALAVLMATSTAALARDVVGRYENRSESAFSYSRNLQKDGKAVYEEPDPESGKNLVLRGRWSQEGNQVMVDFGAKGKYRYEVQDKLSWAAFGCKGATFGLANRATARAAKPDAAHDLWLKADLRNADACTPA
jgi:hypothetical protein